MTIRGIAARLDPCGSLKARETRVLGAMTQHCTAGGAPRPHRRGGPGRRRCLGTVLNGRSSPNHAMTPRWSCCRWQQGRAFSCSHTLVGRAGLDRSEDVSDVGCTMESRGGNSSSILRACCGFLEARPDSRGLVGLSWREGAANCLYSPECVEGVSLLKKSMSLRSAVQKRPETRPKHYEDVFFSSWFRG